MDENNIAKDKGSIKILLVEDDYFISDLYTTNLKMAGYCVDYAQDGEEGVEKAMKKPDVILLDIMLPKLNGLEVLKRIKNNTETKDIPVILLTNLGQADVIRQAYSLGAQGYLLKVKLKLEDLPKLVNDFLREPKKVMPITVLDLDSN